MASRDAWRGWVYINMLERVCSDVFKDIINLEMLNVLATLAPVSWAAGPSKAAGVGLAAEVSSCHCTIQQRRLLMETVHIRHGPPNHVWK